mgnify:CR=1 FL=1
MNKKQKVILSLLQEIDEICRRNKIEYYLSPRLTLCAVEGHPFPQNPMFGVVLMKTADMERFRLAVDNMVLDIYPELDIHVKEIKDIYEIDTPEELKKVELKLDEK